MKETTDQKCTAIIKKIVEMNQDINAKDWTIAFAPDWAENSLTIMLPDGTHSHCGGPSWTFDQLVNDIYNLLCHEKGLSYEK